MGNAINLTVPTQEQVDAAVEAMTRIWDGIKSIVQEVVNGFMHAMRLLIAAWSVYTNHSKLVHLALCSKRSRVRKKNAKRLRKLWEGLQ